MPYDFSILGEALASQTVLILSNMKIEQESHAQYGLANSELDGNKVDAKIAFVPIHIQTTASIVAVICVCVLILILCRCCKRRNLEDLYDFVCIRKCKPRNRPQEIEMEDGEWSESRGRTPRLCGERVRDLMEENHKITKNINSSHGRIMEKP